MTARGKSFPKGLHALFEHYRQAAQIGGALTSAGLPGVANRRILFCKTEGGIERRFHATKGWRTQRVAA